MKTPDPEKANDLPGVSPDLNHPSSPTTQNAASYTPSEERALLLKQDLTILPLSAFIYFLCYLDRSNIGNARILNSSTHNDMQTEIHATQYQFNIALMVFLVAYALFEVPSNILLKKLRPSRWLSFLMFSWGAVTISLGAVSSFPATAGVRFLLGACEAGLFPGLVYYLTFWYRADERSVRVSFILASATLAGAFGGAIAFGIGHMNGSQGLSAWRWLFIIEGAPSCASAVLVWFFLPDYPEEFLKGRHKEVAVERLKVEGSKSYHRSMTWVDAKTTLTDWRLYAHYVIYFGVSVPFSSLSLFAPSITAGLGYVDLKAQLMTVPPYAVAYVVQILVAFSADHSNSRGIHVSISALLGAAGFIASALLPPESHSARYGCLILASAGSFSTVPPLLGWLTSNVHSTAAVGLAIAINVSFGAGIGQIPGVWIYKADEKQNGYPTGHWVNGGMLLMVCVGAALLRVFYGKWNKELSRKQAELERERGIPAEGEGGEGGKSGDGVGEVVRRREEVGEFAVLLAQLERVKLNNNTCASSIITKPVELVIYIPMTRARLTLISLHAASALALPVSSPVHNVYERQEGINHQHLECNWDTFSAEGVLPSGTTLENVTSVAPGGSFGEGEANIPYPMNPTNLPPLCAVTVRVDSSPTSSYRFGLFLPEEWNLRLLVVGNGGFAGGINWLDMAAGPRYGMASLSTDTGHSSNVTDTSWALGEPEKKTDWGWRALHGSLVLGKKLVSHYYSGNSLAYTYYNGCSTGGRQGLKELQVFPDSFDGALIGAPAWWPTHLNTWLAQIGWYNFPVDDPKHIPLEKFTVMAAEVMRQCDGVDGVLDGIISTPEKCDFDFDGLLCGADGIVGQNTSACFTYDQINTAKKLYDDTVSSEDGKSFLYPGFNLGSEEQWLWPLGGKEPTPFGVGYLKDFVFDDKSWDWQSFNESAYTKADETDPGDASAMKYDIGDFKERGGKLILYHGLADGLVPTRGSEYYYNKTIEVFGGDVDHVVDFFRFFLVPGMQHCWSTACGAPWSFGGAFQGGLMGSEVWSVPEFEDQDHDALLALMDWVEKNRTVDKIVATTWTTALDPTSGLLRQRPICPWPQRAEYDGFGDVDLASSWQCVG
ncbi:tannase and feruloyl esterase-domain-containing protein [Podospora australis]|uniref:Carboxylic ester hydrolase n=1 Tax=Podospora australis TaxID=1536484 RepID=A0AAN7AKR9_9PEZI|nr:tannase and feruloyl esterase-domain-containing protein [Podospora australis]